MKGVEKKNTLLFVELNKHIEIIVRDPNIGKNLKGDLQGFKSFDFKIGQVAIRICYFYHQEDNYLTFVYFGTRENFYKEIKRYFV